MRGRRSVLGLLLLLSLTAAAVQAQTPTAGELRWQSGGTVPGGPYTYVDASRPVTADGVITHAALHWLTDAACTDEIRRHIDCCIAV